MMKYIWVNIGSGNGLLPDGNKPLSEPMLTYHQRCSVAISKGVLMNIIHKLSWEIIFSISLPPYLPVVNELNYRNLGPSCYQFLHDNSYLTESLFCFYTKSDKVIATKLCTWPDSLAAMACAKNCSNGMVYNEFTAIGIFYREQISREIPSVNRPLLQWINIVLENDWFWKRNKMKYSLIVPKRCCYGVQYATFKCNVVING